MRIDWRKLPAGATLPATDWADPTHAPLMVADVVEDCGNLSECLTDAERDELNAAAIDAMPGGEAAVRAAVTARVYELAAAGGWSEYLFDPATGRHPEDSCDDAM